MAGDSKFPQQAWNWFRDKIAPTAIIVAMGASISAWNTIAINSSDMAHLRQELDDFRNPGPRYSSKDGDRDRADRIAADADLAEDLSELRKSHYNHVIASQRYWQMTENNRQRIKRLEAKNGN